MFKKKVISTHKTREEAENAKLEDARKRYNKKFKSLETLDKSSVAQAYLVENGPHKEFLYVGHYVDTKGRYILKIGTTNDLKRRAAEHTAHYREAKSFTMPQDEKFHYDWHLPLSKYNTLRYEDANRQRWQEMGIGQYIRNDRFLCGDNPGTVSIIIRKTYLVNLSGE